MTPTPLDSWDGHSVADLPARWGVASVEAYTTIGSTNDRAGEIAHRDEPGLHVVLAEEQSEGRGRRGTEWVSPKGTGLLMSVVLPSDVPPLPHLTLRIGLAAARALGAFTTSENPIGIKWPNDLVAGGRKVAGILAEGVAGRAIVGIGVNVRPAADRLPADLRATSIALEEIASKSLQPSEVAGAIVGAISAATAAGRAPLTSEELRGLASRDVLVGRAVVWDGGQEGIGAGIGSDGAFLLETEDGAVHRLVAGRVRLR